MLSLLFFSSLLSLVLSDPQCQPYTGSSCQFIIGTYQNKNGIYSQSAIVTAIAEGIISAEFANLTLVGPASIPKCFLAATKFFCSENFPACDNSTSTLAPIKGCRSVCQDFVKECKESFEVIGKAGLIPTSCDSYVEEGQCEKMDSVQIPSQFEFCNPPLVPNPDPSRISLNCPGHCCIPCPLIHNFYPENLIQNSITSHKFFSALSFFGSLFVFISYAVLPDKRKFPQSIVLSLSLTGVITFTGTWLVIFGGEKSTHCYQGLYTIDSTMVNPVCSAQGSIILYGILLAASWFALLVTNIHLNVVWKTQRLGDFSKIFYFVFWLWPIVPVAVVNSYKAFSYTSGTWCAPVVGIWIQATLLIPLALLIFPSFLVNLVTLVKIFIVARERQAKLPTILRIQLRPFFFTFTVIIILISYWTYAQALQSAASTEISLWLFEWMLCIQKGGSQNECSAFAKGHVPSVIGFYIAEFLVHNIGVIVFVFFGLKKDIYREWLILLGISTASSFSHGNLSSYSNERAVSHVGSPDKTIQELSTK